MLHAAGVFDHQTLKLDRWSVGLNSSNHSPAASGTAAGLGMTLIDHQLRDFDQAVVLRTRRAQVAIAKRCPRRAPVATQLVVERRIDQRHRRAGRIWEGRAVIPGHPSMISEPLRSSRVSESLPLPRAIPAYW